MRMDIIYISIQSTDAASMKGPVESLCDEMGWDVRITCANDADIDADPLLYHDLAGRVRTADLVLIRCMSDPTRMRRFADLEKVLHESEGFVMVYSGNMEVGLMYRDLFKGDDGEYARLLGFVRGRGPENDRGIVTWLHRMVTGEGEVPEPVVHRSCGIHHPRFDEDVTLEEYLSSLDGTRPTVGLMYPANLWIYGNQAHVDALIEEFEAQGMNVIPVFFSATVGSDHSKRGTVSVVEEYLMDGDRPRVDAVVMTTPFSQLNNSRDCSGIYTPDEQNFYHTLTGVPVFQAMTSPTHFSDYEEQESGAAADGFKVSVIWAEVDGQIITVPVGSNEGGRGGPKRYSPIMDRIHHLVRAVGGWVRLARKPPSERRVALLMYQSRPDSGRIGNAAGLDTVQSVRDILARLSVEGYGVDHVPVDQRAMVEEILDGITNDLEWSSPERVREKAAGTMTVREYSDHYSAISEFNRSRMEDAWGKPPGTVCVEDGRFVIPGIVNGNVYIGYQPLRSWADQMEAVYHDPVIPMPHQYLAFYRWLRDIFKADVVVHMGTHGTLEWLPGRNLGLSSKCFPDIVLDGIPNVYPYVIDDPGEGIQAKRRSEAVLIGHMCPTMTRAGTYDEIESVDGPLQEYFKARTSSTEVRTAILRQLLEAIRKVGMAEELGIPEDVDPDGMEAYVEAVHDHVSEVKDSLIRDGLHVLGRVPEGDLLLEDVYSLTRLRNGDVPSLRGSVAAASGYDIDELVSEPSGITDGRVNSQILDEVESRTMSLLESMQEAGFDTEECLRIVGDSEGLRTVTRYICAVVVPNILRMSDEMDNLLAALDGRYVLPGPSGAPTRGNASILPMGRNYYGIDPDIVPTPAAWEIGRRMADRMVERYVEEKGTYPREIGFIVWATDTMKTNGDDVAYILWLMGVRPVWSPIGGQVTGLEPVSLSELGRPRLDVTVRITGLFRDAFPNLIDLIDDAVKLIAGLDESDEDNALASNLRRDIVEGMASGLTVDEARRRGSVRIFGCPPGGYGAGVNHAIETGDWKTVQDLADIYIRWGSHAYGRDISGESMRDEFVRRFSKVAVTVKNMPDREIDLLDIDDVYGYLGGLNSFVRAYGRGDAISYMGDGSDPDRVKVRDTKEELALVYRSKVLNPRFVEGLKRHGYRGVSEIANLTEYTFGWDATSDVVDDWMYQKLTERYLFDDDTRVWMEDENPHAMMDIMDRLFEAIDRGMWNADSETVDRLKAIYLELEERVEEVNDR